MLIGSPAPDFEMLSTKNLDTLAERCTLKDYHGRWLILFFYPGDFTFVCPSEMIAFNEAVPLFAEHHAELLGVSTDGVYVHVAWMDSMVGYLDFPLASDRNWATSRAYNVLDEEEGIAGRAIVIVDPDGIVRYEVNHADQVGRSPKEILRVLTALQGSGRTFAVNDLQPV
jgi:peroxiredoxin (alkyl hydroperoxide reductase subunit C)